MKIITPAINVCKVADLPFNAFMGLQAIGLYAMSEKAAKQRAIEYFQPRKSERDKIVIKSAEEHARSESRTAAVVD